MVNYIAQARVTGRKQIAIPKKVQDILGSVEQGSYVLFYEESKRIYIKKGVLVPAPE